MVDLFSDRLILSSTEAVKMAEIGRSQPWEALQLIWKTGRPLPYGITRGAAVAHDSLAYFSSEYGHDVFTYNSERKEWSKLPKCPQTRFGLAVINSLLTAVGGDADGLFTSCLSSFSDGKWVQVFPPMPTKRYWPAVISAQHYLIAAGGWALGGVSEPVLSTVEVMDTDSLEWHTAASVPYPADHMSATVCGGRLYILGGRTKYNCRTNQGFTCTLDSLICSCCSPSETPSYTNETRVWQRVADVPVSGSTCATLNGRVLAIGGNDSHGNPIPTVHTYNLDSNVWLPLVNQNMPSARSFCLVVGLESCVIAVGGFISSNIKCATVEVGYLQLSGGCCMYT